MTASYTLYFLQGEDIKTCSMMDRACQLCSRSKTRQILPHLWPRVHIFNSSNKEISKHLTRSKMDRVFKFGLRSKNSSKYLIVYATGIATLKSLSSHYILRHYRPETTSKPQPSRWPLLTEAGTPTTWPIRKVCQFSRCTGRSGPPRPIFGRQSLHSGSHISDMPLLLLPLSNLENPGKAQALGALPTVAALPLLAASASTILTPRFLWIRRLNLLRPRFS